jgi:LCP family protein required for cell wall assembly
MTVQTPRRPSSSPGPIYGGSRPGAGTETTAKKPAKRRDPLWARLTVVFGAVLMMTSGAAIVGSKWLISSATGSINQQSLLDADSQDTASGKSLDGPINLLLLGVDVRPDWDINDTRADSILILHIPAHHRQAFLLSVPRDTEVQAPAFDKARYPGGIAKATEVFYHGAQNGAGWSGGAQLMGKTLTNATGIKFDGAAIIDFGGFKGIIEALGGVHMCVDQDVESIHMYMVDGKPTWKAEARKLGKLQKPVMHKKGCRNMAAWEALDFARQRKGLANGDYDRQRHQQQLLKAMAKKATESGVATNPLKLKQLMQAAGKAFVLDTGGVEIADFVFTLKDVAANDLVLMRTNGGTFSGNGSGREVFNAESQAMFEAVKTDKLEQFVLDNPGVIAKDK